MRDLVVLALIGICLVVSLRKPVWGGLAWIFVSVSSFHQQGWTTSGLPVAWAVAVCLVISILIHRGEFRFSWSSPLVWLALLTVWVNITYMASMAIDLNYPMWNKVMKIFLPMFILAGVIQTRKDIDSVIWILVLSLALTGSKGGVFTLATGGNYRVWGPGGFIGGNNEFALALVMTIPLMHYLRTVTTNKWIKLGLLAAMVLCAIAALGSHSRGAFLAIVAMGLMLIARSNNRSMLIILMLALVALTPVLMTEQWFDRMRSITDYQNDMSAMGRINAWTMAFNLALHQPFGSSFENVTVEYFAKYGLNTAYIQGPHSIYFQMLGQHGFVGLALFLALGVSTWRSANRVIGMCDALERQQSPDVLLMQMIKVSYVGFAVGGAFLALAYFDMPYYLMLVVASLHKISNSAQPMKAGNTAASGIRPKALA